MTRREHMDRAFASALEPLLAERVERPSGPSRADAHLRRQAAVAVLVSALVVVGTVAALRLSALRTDSGSAARPAPTITVAGRAMHLVGTVTWSDAVELSPTRIRVDAAPYPVHGHVFNCGAHAVRPRVSESSDRIVITADAYDFVPPSRLPPGALVGCDAVGRGPITVVVPLESAVGGRPLVDATGGSTHPLLDPTSVPVPTSLPAGYVASAWTRWQETPGAATRIWYRLTPRKGSYTDFSVTVLPGRTPMVGGPRSGREVGRTTVHGHPGSITLYEDSYDWSEAITWSADGTSITVATHGNARNHRSLAELEQVARSTPDP